MKMLKQPLNRCAIHLPAVTLLAGFFAVWAVLEAYPTLVVADQAAPEPVILALVNDEPITEREFNDLLKTRHLRRAEKTGSTKDFRGLLDEMIADRLIIQEGIRMGLDQDPDVSGQLELIEKSSAADLLIRREVKERVEVTEAETKEYFDKLFEQVHPRQIVVKTREEAEAVLKELQGGADFAQLAQERSKGPKAKEGGDLGTFAFHEIYRPLEEGVSALKVGEVSQPIQAPDGFHIVKLEERIPADQELWPKYKDKVGARLRAKKERERYRAFIEDLRAKAKITVHRSQLEGIDRQAVLKGFPEKPDESVAEVEDTSISLGFFWHSLGKKLRLKTVTEQEFPSLKEEALNELIDRVILRKEAENRKLTEDAEVQRQVAERQVRLLKSKFIRLVVLPQIDQKEEALRGYYTENKERYRQPGKFRLARLTASTEEKAAEMRRRVQAGTNFSWIVEHESEDPQEVREKGGDLGWVSEDSLEPKVKEAVGDLPVGGLSEPLKSDSSYHVYYMKDKQQGDIAPFETVKRQVLQGYLRDKVESTLARWVEQLKAASTVTINEERLKWYEKTFVGAKN